MTYSLRGNSKQGWHVPVSETVMFCGVELTGRILKTPTCTIHLGSVCEKCLRIARAERQMRKAN